MKYLIILILPFFISWVQVDIKDLQGKKTHGAKFETQAKADAWIAKQQESKIQWQQKGDRWLKNPTPEDLARKTDEREVCEKEFPNSEEVCHTEYFIPKEYTITITDISDEVDLQKRRAAKIKLTRQALKNKTNAQIDAMDMAQLKKLIKRLLDVTVQRNQLEE